MQNPITPLVIALLFVLSDSRAARAQPTQPTQPNKYEEAFTKIAAVAQQFLAEEHAPGMSLSITDRDKTLKIFTFGVADLKTRKPVTPETLFGVGSITKSMTSMALLQLRDESRFDPARPVVQYLPYFKVLTAYAPITGRDLLTHTSGLPQGIRDDVSGPYVVYALREVGTGFAPGSHFSYSNNGYYTLGRLLERLEGRRYVDIIQDRIFKPLGMTESQPASTYENRALAATGYVYALDDRPSAADYPLVEAPFPEGDRPSGAVLSNAGDMARYLRFLLSGGNGPNARLLSSESFDLLTHPAVKAGMPVRGSASTLYERYAYGLAEHAIDGHAVIGHTGATRPYTACMEADVEEGVGAVALINLGGSVASRPCPVVEYALKALRAVDEQKPLPAMPPAKDPLRVEKAADYAGTFHSQNSGSLSFSAANDRLFLRDGAMQKPMYPRGEDAFWVDDPRFRLYLLRFGRDGASKVATIAYGPETYSATAYLTASNNYLAPASWRNFTGHYRAGDIEWGANFRIFIREHSLWLQTPYDGSEQPLTPLHEGEFRVGKEIWSPERLRFDTVVDGKALRAIYSGQPYYRTFTP